MGGPGSGRWPAKPAGTHLGHSERARDARRADPAYGHVKIPEDSSIGSPQPKPEGGKEWSAITKAWWKSLGQSEVAKVYQPIDWANAWIAALVLEQMVTLGFQAGLYAAWQHTCEWLHAPRLEFLEQGEAAEVSAPVDEDEAEAEDAVKSAMSALRVA